MTGTRALGCTAHAPIVLCLVAVHAHALVAVGPSAPTSTTCLIHPLIALHPSLHPSIHPPPPPPPLPTLLLLFVWSALLCVAAAQLTDSLCLGPAVLANKGARPWPHAAAPPPALQLSATKGKHHHLRLATLSPPRNYLAPPPTAADSQTPRRPLSLARSWGQTCTPLHRTAPAGTEGVPYYNLAQNTLEYGARILADPCRQHVHKVSSLVVPISSLFIFRLPTTNRTALDASQLRLRRWLLLRRRKFFPLPLCQLQSTSAPSPPCSLDFFRDAPIHPHGAMGSGPGL